MNGLKTIRGVHSCVDPRHGANITIIVTRCFNRAHFSTNLFANLIIVCFSFVFNGIVNRVFL